QQRDPVPELDEHADPAHHLVAAAGGPGRLRGTGPHPDEVVELVLGGRVGDAVVEAEQVSLRAGGARVVGPAVDAVLQLHAGAGVLGDVADGVHDGVPAVGA